MHVHVHGGVGEFSKTGAKRRASVIDSAKITLFPAKDAVKMPMKCSKMLAVLVLKMLKTMPADFRHA